MIARMSGRAARVSIPDRDSREFRRCDRLTVAVEVLFQSLIGIQENSDYNYVSQGAKYYVSIPDRDSREFRLASRQASGNYVLFQSLIGIQENSDKVS